MSDQSSNAIHSTSGKRNSTKFTKNNALNVTKFIGNSSPLATVVALYNSVGLITPPFVKGERDEHASDGQMAW